MLSKFTLLYVEDEKDMAEITRDILKDKVKDIYLAHDGKEGLALYKEKNPDIVITDINMPLMDGLQMSKEIKKIDPEQPIIVFTAFNDKEFFHRSIEIGIDGYISKPLIGFDKLLKPLKKVTKLLQYKADEKNRERVLSTYSKTLAVSEMISNIAHQWRQPLNQISMVANNIKLKILLENTNKEMLIEEIEQISQYSQELSSTITDFRSFVNTDNEQDEEFELEECIEKTRILIKESLMVNHIIFEVNIKDQLFIRGNQNQMINSLLNICNNGIFAIKENKPKQRYIIISVQKQDNKATITIKDSAGGIDVDILDKIFEPYTTLKHQSIGTGVGLYVTFQAITKVFGGIIEAKNIEYEYKNKKLKGAIFTIMIDIVNT